MIKPPLITLFLIGMIAVSPLKTDGQSAQSGGQKAALRNQGDVVLVKAAIAKGDEAYKEKHYDIAVGAYQSACDLLPEAPLTHDLRARALDGFSQASMKFAEERIVEERFTDANNILMKILDSKYNPGYPAAIRLLAQLEDPDYRNEHPSSESGFADQDVKILLAEAKGFYDAGRYDVACKYYDEALSLEPDSIEARKGLEMAKAAGLKYPEDAHEIVKIGGMEPPDPRHIEYIRYKLDHIIIPKIEFKEVTVREIMKILHKKSIELDTEPDPARKGINFALKLDTPRPGSTANAPAISPGDMKITYTPTNVPLSEALHVIAVLATMQVKILPYGVAIIPLSEDVDPLITKEYKVPPGIFFKAPIEYLQEGGVQFPRGAAANYLPASGKLVVRNTEENLDMVDHIVKNLIDKQSAPGEKPEPAQSPVPLKATDEK